MTHTHRFETITARKRRQGPGRSRDTAARGRSPPPYVEPPLEHLRYLLPVLLVATLPEVTEEPYLLPFLSADELRAALDGSLLVGELCPEIHRLSLLAYFLWR